MSGAAASEPGADRRGSLRRALGAWLLAPDFYREREVRPESWVEALFEPAALTILIGLFLSGVVGFGLAVVPAWDARLVLPLGLVVALQGFLYARRLARPSVLLKEWAALLAPPVLVLRFLPYALGPDSLAADLAEWWRSPASFFSATFVVNLLLLLLAWWLALGATLDLNRLRLQPGELPPEASAARQYDLYDDGWRHVDHATPLRNLALRVLWGGVLLVVLAALAALEVGQVASPAALLQLVALGRPSVSLAYSNVVLYFVVGLLLLAEAQLVKQQTAWQLERLTPPPSLASRWVAAAVAATAGIVGIALVLPTAYALTIADLLGALSAVAAYVVQAILGLVLLVVYLVTWPLRWLFPGGGEEPTAPAPPPVLPPPAPPSEPVAWLALAQSLVFWAVALAIVVYLLSVVWRRRPPLPAWLRAGSLAGLAAALWRMVAALSRWGRAAAVAVVAALPRLRPAPAEPVRRAFRWLALSRLGPRELVEYFYLSVIERAARLGYAREKGETASEFSRKLPARLPDVEPDLSALTRVFLEARYSPRPVEEGLVRSARARWQRLKLKLRRQRLGRLG